MAAIRSFGAVATRVQALRMSSVGARCMATGAVKWFDVTKGFGFITPDEQGQPDRMYPRAV